MPADRAPVPGRGRWLADAPEVERLDLGGGSWVDVVRGIVPDADEAYEDVLASVAWRQGKVFRYERWVPEPRLGGYQPAGDAHPALVEVGAWLADRYAVRFDGPALAQYRHGRDSVGFHRDREMTWLEDTLIGVLTLGATRPFLLRRNGTGRADEDDLSDALDVRPSSGDLLVMGGRCQVDWLHAVPKVDRPVRPRISAQWRWTSRRGRPDTAPKYSAPRRYGRR